jgi:Cys-rich protein (TIGR01571 family)
MQRLRLNWLGEGGEDESAKISFKVVLALVICYTVFTICLETAEAGTYYYAIPAYIPALKFIGGILFTIYSIYALMRLRENVRAKYSIPENTRCAGCEDVVYSVCCSCCVVAQIARHTGEYETYKGSYCTETGMATGTPIII